MREEVSTYGSNREGINLSILIDKLLKCRIRICSLSMLNKTGCENEFPGGSVGIPMFSYYGNSHKGLAIEYNKESIDAEAAKAGILKFNVDYSSLIDKTNSGKNTTFPVEIDAEEMKLIDDLLQYKTEATKEQCINLINRIVGYKKDCWNHENEYRLVSIDHRVITLGLPSNAVEAVYFGVNMPLARKKYYMKLIGEISKERKSPRFYCCALRYDTLMRKDVLRIFGCSDSKPCDCCQWLGEKSIWTLSLDQ